MNDDGLNWIDRNDGARLDPNDPDAWPDPTTEPVPHPLIGHRVRVTLARKGEPAELAVGDFFDEAGSRKSKLLRRPIRTTGVLERLMASGDFTVLRDDGLRTHGWPALEIAAAPSRWWHWDRAKHVLALLAAACSPFLVLGLAFWIYVSAGWSTTASMVAALLVTVPWTVMLGELMSALLSEWRYHR